MGQSGGASSVHARGQSADDPAAGCCEGLEVATGAVVVSFVDVKASSFARESCHRVWDGMCAQTPPEMTPVKRTATEIVLSRLRNIVFNTPRVRERTEADTDFVDANRVTAVSRRFDRRDRNGLNKFKPGNQDDRRGNREAAAFESGLEKLSTARKPAAHRADRSVQQSRCLLVRFTLKVAKHDRHTVFVRQSTKLFLE